MARGVAAAEGRWDLSGLVAGRGELLWPKTPPTWTTLQGWADVVRDAVAPSTLPSWQLLSDRLRNANLRDKAQKW